MRSRKLTVGVLAGALMVAPLVAAPAAGASTCEVGAPGGEVVCAGFFAAMDLTCKVASKVTKEPSCWA